MKTKWTFHLCVCVCACVLLYLLHDENCTEYFTSKARTLLWISPSIRPEVSSRHFLLVSVHLYCHHLRHVGRFPFVFKSATSASLLSSSFLSLFSHLTSPLYLSSSIVFPTALIPWHRSCSIFHPPIPAPLLPVSSSKRVFGCQCQSVGGGDESVALTASLEMTISADCHISLFGGGVPASYALSICPHIIICHGSLLIWWPMDLSVSKRPLLSACLTRVLCHTLKRYKEKSNSVCFLCVDSFLFISLWKQV